MLEALNNLVAVVMLFIGFILVGRSITLYSEGVEAVQLSLGIGLIAVGLNWIY
jgi:small-conductance mechanosensitive channel